MPHVGAADGIQCYAQREEFVSLWGIDDDSLPNVLAVESVDPNVMREKIEDFEKTFEQRHGRKMRDDELAMLKTAKEIVERELWAEKLGTKAA